MAGLFDSLSLGARSLQAHRQGVDVAGHNLANVNTAGYARQRAVIQSASTPTSGFGSVGAGADAVSIETIRNKILDTQILQEGSVSGGLETREYLLQQTLASFGSSINRTGVSSATAGNDTFSGGISDALNNFFTSAQALSVDPNSDTNRQSFLDKAQNLANAFGQTAAGIDSVAGSIDSGLEQQVREVNTAVGRIAELNNQIARAESRNPGSASDLRNSRQLQLESLAKIIPVSAVENANGSLDILLNGNTVLDATGAAALKMGKAADGTPTFTLVGTTGPIQITSGSIGASVEVRQRDIPLANTELDQLARAIITEVNARHASGFSLTGSTGSNLFLGDSARTISVNPSLLENSKLLQLSSNASALGDNSVVLQIGTLGRDGINSLAGKTFTEHHLSTVTSLGHELANTTRQLEDQNKLESMLSTQRESISGVSVDEEVSTMVKFQKAFEASARFIQVADEMLDVVLNLKR